MKRVGLALAATILVAGSFAAWLFPRAIPTVVLDQRLTRQLALQRADSFFRAHDLAPPAPRAAVRFQADDSLLIFVDLAAGGKDTLEALVRGHDVAAFTWSVRAFVPGDVHEARVHFAPDGRVVGFRRTFAEADARPTISPDSARALADHVLGAWLGEATARWKLETSSYETRKTSGRVDRTYTFERTDRKVGAAPIRLDVVIAGDTPSSARSYAVIPEAFSRRYGEMRSANDFLALLATLGILGFGIAGVVALRRYAKSGQVRWREPLVVGGVIGAILTAAALNEVSLSWYGYDTATSPAVFEATIFAGALFAGVASGALVALTLAAAEALARDAFPAHLDWWKLWKLRGTREVAGRVAGGYAVAAIGVAYVALFYVITRKLLGWWVPSELLDDPNQIATPMPWLAGLGLSLQAGVWEEALFRALPLSLFSLWVGTRPRRNWWMALGVMGSALVFGFAHANYTSWPPYSRGVEIFFDACFWGVLFLTFGILVTVVAHFVYDLLLFGLFASAGTAIEYRVTAAIIVLALLAPAIAVVWQWIRQRGLLVAGGDARFAAWTPHEPEAEVPASLERTTHTLGARARMAAVATTVAAVFAVLVAPSTPVLGPRFTAARSRAIAVADSMLRARGEDPARWRRLARTVGDTSDAWPRFLHQHDAARLARDLAATYQIPAWWVVRYVRDTAAVAARAEEWRVRVLPDGTPLDARHIVPEGAHRDSPDATGARRIARLALERAGYDTLRLAEAKFEATARPARTDVTVTYTDSSTKLPGEAAARVWVSLAGDEPVVVRRGVELPETFLRADRDHAQRRAAISLFCGLALALSLVGGVIFVARRRAPLLDDVGAARRTTIVLVAALAIVLVGQSLNGMYTTLYLYDTATPWSTFVTEKGIGIALAFVPALMIWGLWLVLDSLRRRVGIPLLGDGPADSRRRDALVAGLGLGSIFTLLQRVSAFAAAQEIAGAPQTVLDQVVPALSGVLGTLAFVAMVVPLVAIPGLTIAGISRRRSVRISLWILMITLVAGAGASAAEFTYWPGATAVAVGVESLVVLLWALRTWGSACAWSWIVAALVNRALAGAHVALHAASSSETLAGALGIATSLALLALALRRMKASDAPSAPTQPG